MKRQTRGKCAQTGKAGLMSERALVQLRRFQHHHIRLNGADPMTGALERKLANGQNVENVTGQSLAS